MSGTGGSALLQLIAGGIVGGIGGGFINSKVAAMTKPIDPKILSIVEILGGGVVAAKLAKGNPLITGIGLGLAVGGGMNLGKTFGIGSFPSVPILNGTRRTMIKGVSNRLPGMNGAYNPYVKAPGVLQGIPDMGCNPNGSGSGAAM